VIVSRGFAPVTCAAVTTVAVSVAAMPDARRGWLRDALLLAVGALVLRLPALLASRHLTFDDGQYGTVVLGLRDGDLPFRDLFSSQGPLYYPLLGLADLIGFRTLDGPRVLTVAAGIVAAIATYEVARHVTGRGEALFAGALVATSGSILYVTGPLSGDGPALALALAAVATACSWRVRPTTWRAILTGALMGAALCVKLLVLPAAIPIGVLWLGARPRRVRDGVLAVAGAIGVGLASALPWGIDRVWDQSVAYHRDSERLRSYGGNAWTLLRTLAERDPFVLAAAVAAGVTALVVLWRTRHGETVAPAPRGGDLDRRTALWMLVPWLVAQAVFLVAEPAMWRPHVSQIVAPLALLSVLRPAPWRVLAVLGVLLVPWWLSNAQPMLWPDDYSRAEAQVVARLRQLPDDAWVISDDPGFAWRAGHRVPGQFVDVSMKRFQQGALTLDDVREAARDERVCAVVVWSRERLGSLPGLAARLEDLGYANVATYPGSTARSLYERPRCSKSRRSGS
jgi:Dolichyl-phosphate-mannose-protein mannosyltransferase